jgi:hypothetical protein
MVLLDSRNLQKNSKNRGATIPPRPIVFGKSAGEEVVLLAWGADTELDGLLVCIGNRFC